MKQYKRPSVNIPKKLLAALDKRIVEVGYPSHSAYFLGLMLFDLWAGQGHAVAVKMMSLPPKERAAAMEDIGRRYLAGERSGSDGFFGHEIERQTGNRKKPKLGLAEALQASESLPHEHPVNSRRQLLNEQARDFPWTLFDFGDLAEMLGVDRSLITRVSNFPGGPLKCGKKARPEWIAEFLKNPPAGF